LRRSFPHDQGNRWWKLLFCGEFLKKFYYKIKVTDIIIEAWGPEAEEKINSTRCAIMDIARPVDFEETEETRVKEFS
jgi:hypothetical protein